MRISYWSSVVFSSDLTDPPMIQTSNAWPDVGFVKDPAASVADAIVDGIATDAFEVSRGRETRAKMIATNRENPAALDERFLGLKPALAEAVRGHSAL